MYANQAIQGTIATHGKSAPKACFKLAHLVCQLVRKLGLLQLFNTGVLLRLLGSACLTAQITNHFLPSPSPTPRYTQLLQLIVFKAQNSNFTAPCRKISQPLPVHLATVERLRLG